LGNGHRSTEFHNAIANLPEHYGSWTATRIAALLKPNVAYFEPRVGFAWDSFSGMEDGSAAGFGMFDVPAFAYQFHC